MMRKPQNTAPKNHTSIMQNSNETKMATPTSTSNHISNIVAHHTWSTVMSKQTQN